MIKNGDGVVSTLNREPLVHCFQAIAGDGHVHPEFRELPTNMEKQTNIRLITLHPIHDHSQLE